MVGLLIYFKLSKYAQQETYNFVINVTKKLTNGTEKTELTCDTCKDNKQCKQFKELSGKYYYSNFINQLEVYVV